MSFEGGVLWVSLTVRLSGCLDLWISQLRRVSFTPRIRPCPSLLPCPLGPTALYDAIVRSVAAISSAPGAQKHGTTCGDYLSLIGLCFLPPMQE